MVEELRSYTQQDAQELGQLLTELSPKSNCSGLKLDRIINSQDSYVYVIRVENKIVAAACLCVGYTTECTVGYINAVVVSGLHRGKHLGRELITHIIKEAERLNVNQLQLTSNPKRVAANKLYQAIGFTNYETNCYHYNL